MLRFCAYCKIAVNIPALNAVGLRRPEGLESVGLWIDGSVDGRA